MLMVKLERVQVNWKENGKSCFHFLLTFKRTDQIARYINASKLFGLRLLFEATKKCNFDFVNLV